MRSFELPYRLHSPPFPPFLAFLFDFQATTNRRTLLQPRGSSTPSNTVFTHFLVSHITPCPYSQQRHQDYHNRQSR